MRTDCILCQLRLTKPSLLTNSRAVVEGKPYSVMLTSLGFEPADCPIFNVITMSEVITLDITPYFYGMSSS